MGQDKGTLDYHGLPQAEHCYRLLAAHCTRVFISVNCRQSRQQPYPGLPLLEDTGEVAGPAAGLLAAWAACPGAALLVLAVDLPLVDDALLASLFGHRDPDRPATLWVHPDGVLEPLCAIWEPIMHAALLEAAEAGNPSLRRLLEGVDAMRLNPPDPQQITSINTKADFDRISASLARG